VVYELYLGEEEEIKSPPWQGANGIPGLSIKSLDVNVSNPEAYFGSERCGSKK